MNANDLIDSYVADVARLLGRKQRHDVAFELRALLVEELDAKAGAAGRAPDAALAMELLAGFGRPAEVAARYRPALVLIDPADARTFVRASVIGMAIWWILGMFAALARGPIDTFGDALNALQVWWLGSALAAFWWPGFLLVCFAIGAWTRRRWPATAAWKPRPAERDRIHRFGYAMAVAGMVIGMLVLVEPSRVLDVFFDGRAAPAAYDALTFDPDFARLRAPLLLSILAAYALLYAWVAVQGRWTAVTRRLEIAAGVALSVVMTWVLLDGPVVRAQPSDQMIKGLLALMLALTLYETGKSLLRARGLIRTPAALADKPSS